MRKSRIKPFYAMLKKIVKRNPSSTDVEIANETQTSVRTTKRYIAELRRAGIISTLTTKHWHPGYDCWCNERTIFLGGKHGNDV